MLLEKSWSPDDKKKLCKESKKIKIDPKLVHIYSDTERREKYLSFSFFLIEKIEKLTIIRLISIKKPVLPRTLEKLLKEFI